MLIKKAYKRTLQRGWTRIMETVGVMEREYEKALLHEKNKEGGKSELSDERLEGF